MKIAFFSDPHIAPRASMLRKDDYAETCLRKIDWVLQDAYARGCQRVEILGDLFHHKDPARTTYALINKVYTLFKPHALRLGLTLGNHDLQASGILSVTSQPAGLLIQTEVVDADQRCIMYKGGEEVALTRIHYHTKMHERFVDLIPEPEPKMKNILLSHLYISPDGNHNGVKCEVMEGKGYDWVIHGHTHEAVGPYRVNGVNFVSVGALLRYAIPQAGGQTPMYGILDTDVEDHTLAWEWVDVPHASAEEIFAYAVHKEVKEKKAEFTDFVDTVTTMKLNAGSVQTALQKLEGIIDKNVFETILEYVG